MIRTVFLIACLVALSACEVQPAASAVAAESPAPEASPTMAVVDPIEAQKTVKDLESWDAIIEVMHDENLTVQWTIGVKDDGSKRHGLAESVCMELRDRGLQHPSTWVRIVDRRELMSNGGDFRAASLGTVACEKGQWIDP
jgi:hypothetical protein